MSSRQMRRLQESMTVVRIDDSEEDFQPLYTRARNTFNLLTSQNDEEKGDKQETNKEISGAELSGTSSDFADEATEGERRGAIRRVVARKKKRQTRKQRNKKAAKAEQPPASDNEVEKAVAEVNKMLGEPGASGGPKKVPPSEMTPAHKLSITEPGMGFLKVNPKLLDSNCEFNKRFGHDTEEIRKLQRPNVHQQLKRHITLPKESYGFTCRGLSMEELKVKNGVKYFRFVHSSHYEINVHTLLKIMSERQNTNAGLFPMFPDTTIEAVLQNTDLFFTLEDASIAVRVIEAALSFMQEVFCPGFNYVDGKTRLEYIHVENRPFHIILLKYVYLLTTRACHRTALEVAKIMLSLDPTDPLGVFLIMDTLALRARDHQWLIDVYHYFVEKKDGDRVFHLVYSTALALYELYKVKKDLKILRDAEETLQLAMTQFPYVVALLMEFNSSIRADILQHKLFKPTAESVPGSMKGMQRLQRLYVRLAGPKWREGDNMKWLCAQAEQLMLDYDRNPDVQSKCQMAAFIRHKVFKHTPKEIKRHLYILKPMASWTADTACEQLLSDVKDTYAFNPYPNKGPYLDTYHYFTKMFETVHLAEGLFPDNNPDDSD